MSEWQPIETAPKDGTAVRVTHEIAPGYECDGRYSDGKWNCSNWFIFEFQGRPYITSIPSHWMPLPSPPSETET